MERNYLDQELLSSGRRELVNRKIVTRVSSVVRKDIGLVIVQTTGNEDHVVVLAKEEGIEDALQDPLVLDLALAIEEVVDLVLHRLVVADPHVPIPEEREAVLDPSLLHPSVVLDPDPSLLSAPKARVDPLPP